MLSSVVSFASLDVSWRACVGLVGAGGADPELMFSGGCDKTPRDVSGAGFQAESSCDWWVMWGPGSGRWCRKAP